MPAAGDAADVHPRAREFKERSIERYGFDPEIREFSEGTKTAEDAAAAIGCPVGAIASSLVFAAGDDLVVAVTSGANRVEEARLADALDVDAAAVAMADPDRVRETVGWAIGGVPPFCHSNDLPVLFDPVLADHDAVWAAAGTPVAVFPVAPDRLRRLADATEAAVAVPRE